MKLYITDASIFVLLVFYLPLVLFVLWRIVKSKRWSSAVKGVIAVVFLAIAYAIPLGDVTLNSIAMAKVCPKAGLHVYKQVKVEGYFDRSASEQVLEHYPYRFIEYTRPGEKITHVQRQENGQIVKSILDVPNAEYEIVYEDSVWKSDLRIKQTRWWVRERSSGAAVGEWLMFNPLLGWVDQVLIFRWFGGALKGCSGPSDIAVRWRKELLPVRE